MRSEFGCRCQHFQGVTERSALAAAEWTGRGDGLAAAAAAREAMAAALSEIALRVRVAAVKGSNQPGPLLIGEERGGTGADPGGDGEAWDVVALPLEGMEPLARGVEGALSMLAAGPPGSLLAVPEMYMEKIMLAAEAAPAVDMDAPVGRNLRNIAAVLGRSVDDLVVAVLDRPRHEELASQIRAAGARLRLIPDGDISAGIAAAAREGGIDVCMGIGGAIEGVIAAAALRCLGGEMQARFWPVSRRQVEQLKDFGLEDVEAKLSLDDLTKEGVVFVATAVTGGRFLRGVEERDEGMRTETLVLCSSCNAVRTIETLHRNDGRGRVRLALR